MHDFLKKEAVVIALVTGFIYCCAYVDLLARSCVFNVPASVLNDGAFQFFISGIMTAFTGLTFCLSVYVSFECGGSKFKIVRIISLLTRVLYIPVSLYWFLRELNYSVHLSIIPSGISFLLLLLFCFPDFKTIRGCIVSGDEMGRVSGAYNLNIYLYLKSIKPIYVCFSSVIFLLAIFCTVYKGSAVKKDFNVFYKNHPYAVIAFLSDEVVVKRISNGKLSDGFFIFKKEWLENVEINRKDITKIKN